ncbi:MAG: hypothetical protein ACTHLU_14100 [Novosphingobium sp.]
MLFTVALAVAAQPASTASPEPIMTIEVPGADPVASAMQQPSSRIPPKTVVQIEIAETISSRTTNLGDTFAIKLAEPLVVEGKTILPAGLTGRGEVTHVAKRGWGGRPGELIINARYVDCGDLRIPLGHLHFAVAGQNNFGGAFVTSQFIPMGQLMISGKDASIPAGTKATAQIKAEVAILADSTLQCQALSE